MTYHSHANHRYWSQGRPLRTGALTAFYPCRAAEDGKGDMHFAQLFLATHFPHNLY